MQRLLTKISTAPGQIGLGAIFFVLLGVFLPVFSHAGVDTSGGGDTRSIQFVMMAEELADHLEALEKNGEIQLGIDYPKLRATIEKTKVSVTAEPIYVDGVPKEAKNYPNRNPPEIVLNAERWDAVNEGSRRAAILLHEYLGVMKVDDTKYQISSKIYSDWLLKMYLNNADFAAPPDVAHTLPFAVKCQLYDDGQLVPNALGIVGDSGHIGGLAYSAKMFTGRLVRSTEKGPLAVTVDTGTDPLSQFMGTFKSDVKKPIIRVSIGYNPQFVGPPQDVIVENDLRVTPDFDASVSYPKEKIKVRCKRLTRQDLVDERERFQLQGYAWQCGVHPDEIHQILPQDVRELLRGIQEKLK